VKSKGLSLSAALACGLFASNAAAQPSLDDEIEPPEVARPAATPTQGSAGAPPAEKPWHPANVTLYGHFALTGGPAGIFGGSIEVTPGPHVSFELGAGLGTGGAQLAVNAWLRPDPSPTSAFLLGAGFSGGGYKETLRNLAGESEGSSVQGGYQPAVWFNPQVALEVLWSSGFRLRPYVGASFLLNSGSYVCGSDPAACPGEKRSIAKLLPILGLQIGGAFSN
jgi:hypothetical protein